MKTRHTIRQTAQFAKPYIDRLVRDFAKLYAPNADRVELCKQDSRGVPSITVFGADGCVHRRQVHFNNNAEMLAFVRGYLAANGELV